MATCTLEVTDVPEELLQLLDLRVQHQAKNRSAYVRDLLRQDLKNTQPPELEGQEQRRGHEFSPSVPQPKDC